jgi:hypothetical protein
MAPAVASGQRTLNAKQTRFEVHGRGKRNGLLAWPPEFRRLLPVTEVDRSARGLVLLARAGVADGWRRCGGGLVSRHGLCLEAMVLTTIGPPLLIRSAYLSNEQQSRNITAFFDFKQ